MVTCKTTSTRLGLTAAPGAAAPGAATAAAADESAFGAVADFFEAASLSGAPVFAGALAGAAARVWLWRAERMVVFGMQC